ncbi:ornithine utilization transcriptional regulator OruR [Maricurvus nonylphenolicus]|uniref:AraC family transcriptional regulator n=1 Tax=Maricurvus nonylphenolicus TaxID=1008307 RepID=UPI0036F276D3
MTVTTSPSTDNACIPTSYSRLIATVIGLQERSLGELLAGVALTPAQLTSDATLLTGPQQIQIIRNALRLVGDKGFGLLVGKRLTPPTHGAMGFLANSSPDLRTAIEAFQEFLPTRMYFVRLDMQTDEQWLYCDFHLALDAESVVRRSILEAISLALLSLIEFILGRPLHEGQLCLDYAAPAYRSLYPQYIPCPIRFESSRNTLLIPLELLATVNATADHENYDMALQQCQLMLNQLPKERATTADRVKAYMLTHPPGQLSEDAVAAAMFITKRTLARRLEKEGSSYRQLRDEIFASLAARYLKDSALSVESIAGLLGYHDSANFRRAFKRWFDITPSQYRDK